MCLSFGVDVLVADMLFLVCFFGRFMSSLDAFRFQAASTFGLSTRSLAERLAAMLGMRKGSPPRNPLKNLQKKPVDPCRKPSSSQGFFFFLN